MPANPSDAVSSARDIATESIRKSAEIVENFVEIMKGNVAEGVGGIVKNATDIAANAVIKGKEILTGQDDEDTPEGD